MINAAGNPPLSICHLSSIIYHSRDCSLCIGADTGTRLSWYPARPVLYSREMKRTPRYLSDGLFTRGLSFLCDRDLDLARVVQKYGPPPMWERKAGFPTLIHIILEQQVSLASA